MAVVEREKGAPVVTEDWRNIQSLDKLGRGSATAAWGWQWCGGRRPIHRRKEVDHLPPRMDTGGVDGLTIPPRR